MFQTASSDAADMYAYVLDQYVHDRKISFDVLKRAIELDSAFVHPRCVLGMLDESRTKEMADEVNSIEYSSPYVDALNAYAENRFADVADILDETLLRHPSDLVAVKLASDVLFKSGETKNRRCIVPRVLDRWIESEPGYAQLLSIHANAMTDDGDARSAEDLAMRVLTMEPHNTSAVFAAASSLLVQDRPRECIRLVREFKESLHDDSTMLPEVEQKLAWFWALCDVEQGKYDKALRRFESYGGNAHSDDTQFPLCWGLSDAVSLLMRLKLCGEDIQSHWMRLVDRNEKMSSISTLSSMDRIHAVILFSETGHNDKFVDDILKMMETEGDDVLIRDISKAIVRMKSNPTDGFHALRKLRFQFDRIGGGSILHRDLLNWILLESSLRSENYEHGRAILAEQIATRPGKAQWWRFQAEILYSQGQTAEADQAYIRALDLGLGQGGADSH